jgi:signal transduction histidine kinase/CheY-like chemotaxis protein
LKVSSGHDGRASTELETLRADNARLRALLVEVARVRELELPSQERAQRLLRIHAFTADLAAAMSVEHVAEVVIEHGVAAMGAKTAGIWQFDPERREARLLRSHGYDAAAQQAFALIPLEGSAPLAEAMRQRSAIFIESSDDYARRFPESASRVRENTEFPFVAVACLPLLAGSELLGALALAFDGARSFDSDERTFLDLIAVHCAQGLHRAALYSAEARSRAAAEKASRMKDEFLAIVSHELRTPLAAIAGWASLLRGERRNDPSSVAKGLDVIDRNAKAQQKLIEDILDVSRIIAGKLVIDPRPVSLAALVGESVEAVRASATAKEIVIEIAAADEPFSVVGDPERLRQIIWNLLSNAIKFTPRQGRVSVGVRRELGNVVVMVRDTGRGIEADFLPYVFDRVRQADSSTTRRQGGLGLGLAIVRHLVELHGGTVRAESDGPGLGATFSVGFPVRAVFASHERATPDQPLSASAVDLTGLRVFLVDDEADARELLVEVLAAFGGVVRSAASASDALHAIDEFDPQVLVSDIAMPDEDGYSLIRRVRSSRRGRSLPAIALTSYARADDERRALEAGFDRYLPKPTDPAKLAATIAELCAKPER